MFGFDRIGLQRMAVAAMGAFVLSTTCVGAAVAPASAPLSEAAATAGVQASQFADLANA